MAASLLSHGAHESWSTGRPFPQVGMPVIVLQ